MKTILAIVLAIGIYATVAAETAISETLMPKVDRYFTEETHPQLYCMALNIYHEARSDNLAGQYAVADVVLNRVRDSRWPSTICDVVKEGPLSQWYLEEHGKEVPVRHKCQFSWWCDGKSDSVNETNSWRKAQVIAYQIVKNNLFRGITEGATHYHATYVDPSWNKRFAHIGRIGEHLFYRAD